MELEALVSDYLRHIELERNLSPCTVSQYTRDLNKWLIYLRASGTSLDTDAVDVDSARGWLRHRASQGISPVTVTRELACVRSFWNFACRYRGVDHNPLAAVVPPKTPQQLPDIISRGDIRKLLQACESNHYRPYRLRDKAIIAVLATLGLRRQELMDLRLEDWDATARTVLVRCGKGRKARLLPLSDELIALVQDWLKVRPDGPTDHLFLSRSATSLKPQGLQRMLGRLTVAAGLPQRPHLHMFRHHAATRMVQDAQGGMEKARRMLGHHGYDTLKVYTHLDVDDLRSAVSDTGLMDAPDQIQRLGTEVPRLDPATLLAERALRDQLGHLPSDWQRSEAIVRNIVTEWTRQSVPDEEVPLQREEVERVLWERATVSRLSFDTHLAIAAFGGTVYQRMPETAGQALSLDQMRVVGEEIVRGAGMAIRGGPWREVGEREIPRTEPESKGGGTPAEIIMVALAAVDRLGLMEDRQVHQRLVKEALMGLMIWSYGLPPAIGLASERPLRRLLTERVRMGDALPMIAYCIAKMRGVLGQLQEFQLAVA